MTLLDALKTSQQDFEWYPTTERMVTPIRAALDNDYRTRKIESILDIGAGDGRVLMWLAADNADLQLYAIEKALPLIQAQPERITPVGVDFYEQDLMSLPVDVVFSNPPYSDFETWACRIIDTVFASHVFLILPSRWKESSQIAASLRRRDVKATVIHTDHFLDGERAARVSVDVIHIIMSHDYYRAKADPFETWFDENVTVFDTAAADPKIAEDQRLARIHKLNSITGLVTAFNEDYDRIQDSYRKIFSMDGELLRELGINKSNVMTGMRAKLQGLKQVYWSALFTHLDVLTVRLTTKTKKRFLEKISRHTTVAFTEPNAYAVVLWAIKFANQYFDGQVVDLFRELATHEGAQNYKSNLKTWEKDGWRWRSEQFSHFLLDYRIVHQGYNAILTKNAWESYYFPGGLHNNCHELIDDMIAVFGNLGFRIKTDSPSRSRSWKGGTWENFYREGTEDILFQVKAYQNGNLHMRVLPDAMKALNIEAGRLLGWVRTADEVTTEMGYSADDAARYFGSNARLGTSSVKLLNA